MNPSDAARIEDEIESALAGADLNRAMALAADYGRATEGSPVNGEPARAPSFRAAYLAGQVALAAGQLSRAVEHLSPLLALTGRLPEELACRLRLFAAEALARLHRSREARTLLDQVPAVLLESNPLLQLRALR